MTNRNRKRALRVVLNYIECTVLKTGGYGPGLTPHQEHRLSQWKRAADAHLNRRYAAEAAEHRAAQGAEL